MRLVRADERRGKEYAEKLAVEAAWGDVLVFSDVATMLDADGTRQMVKSFNDPMVGCVSSVRPDNSTTTDSRRVRACTCATRCGCAS